ncbi:MAG: hypothetical protein ACRD0J_13560, partial [Acidimicrobiales bacterium]
FDADGWLRWLDRLPRPGCLFAVAPDVLGDAALTWERSQPYLSRIRAMNFPAALVAQNGWDSDAVDWSAFDALFVGGDTAFKLAATTFNLAAEARARGKWTHMGRVNSRSRLAAATWDYDSTDGTYIAFGPDQNLRKVLGWIDQGHLGDLTGRSRTA